MKSIAVVALAALLSAHVLADEAPKSPCQQPIMPNELSSDMVVKMFNKRMAQYKTCTDKFVAEQRAIAETNETIDAAKSHQAFEAAEAAQKEYNAMIDALNAHKEDEVPRADPAQH